MSTTVKASLVYGLPFSEADFINADEKSLFEEGYSINLIESLICEDGDTTAESLLGVVLCETEYYDTLNTILKEEAKRDMEMSIKNHSDCKLYIHVSRL